MQDRKRRREIIEVGEDEDREGFFILEPVPVELGVGYSVSICHDDVGDEILHVKTYGKLDERELLKELRRKYPKAKIEGLEAALSVGYFGKRKKRKTPKKP